MLVSVKSNMMMVEEPQSGRRFTIIVELENDGRLLIADASGDIPSFVHRLPVGVFPSDSVIEALVGEALGLEHPILKPVNRGVELDPSALLGLKKMPVDIFNNDYLDQVEPQALVLCVDIRNFSQFLRDHKESAVFSLIKDFTSNFLSCVNQFGYGCSYYKLLGDGAIVIWDTTDSVSVSEALLVFDTYIDFVEEELFKPYPEIGLAGALVSDLIYKYEISAEASQLKYRDYVGYGINLACRLQALAKKNQLVINQNLANSGLIPFYVADVTGFAQELHHLKGLKPEDQRQVFFYQSS
jgi:hypothetical protein